MNDLKAHRNRRLSLLAWAAASISSTACAPPEGPSGAEKASAYHAQEAERAKEKESPTPPTEEESTLQFPMCNGKKAPAFPADSEGAAFRAIVFLRITEGGKTSEHCYLAVEGTQKWEEKALGDLATWKYDAAHAGQARERTVTWRLK